MGLDKWIKSEDIKKNSKKKKEPIKKVKVSNILRVKDKLHEKPKTKLKKYTLLCSNTKCKYQKIILKKELTDDDKICPRCNKTMKIK